MNEQRVARVRAEMQAHGLTQMIISDSKSIWYLTGASVEPYERLMALYLPVQGEPVIFLNKLRSQTEAYIFIFLFYHLHSCVEGNKSAGQSLTIHCEKFSVFVVVIYDKTYCSRFGGIVSFF